MESPKFRTLFATKPLTPAVESYKSPYASKAAPPVTSKSSFAAAYAIGAVYLFLVFSHATEFIDTSGRLHLVVLAAFLAAIAAVASGNIPSLIQSSAGLALSIFTAFLILGIPFSSWKGGSFHSFTDSWWKSYIAFFLVGSLIFTAQQMRKSLFVLALGTIGMVYFSFKATKMNDDGRISVEYGSLGNSNDLAGSLLMGLPFLLYVVLDKKRSALIRLLFSGIICVLMLVVFKTGSRSGLIAMAFMAAIMFVKTSVANKLKIVIVLVIAAVALPIIAGKTLMARYKTMFQTSVSSGMSDDVASAVMSTQARRQLMYNAVELTFRHPIFGVGLGNFSNQSNELEISKGRQPLWFTSHDIYLLVSSETGVVGIVLYMATIIFTFGSLLRVERFAERYPEFHDLGNIALCLLMSLVAFASSGVFSTNAYTVQLPLLAGLAAALDRITKPMFASAEERRLENFRQSIPVRPSKFAAAAQSSLSLR